MRTIHSWLCVTVLAVSVLSCSKGGETTDDGGGGIPNNNPNDTKAPDITITTPVAAQSFTNGQVINITGRITDDYGLYRGTIKLVNDATGFALINQPYEIHGFLLYNFNLNHTVAVTTASDYTVTVSFEDHGSNVTTKSVKVKVNP